MQRLASSRRLLQAALAHRRENSSLSAAAAVSVSENGSAAPKMPHFDYTPPPYDGPRAEEIFRKRAQFLSPSFFHFYDRPVSLQPPHHQSTNSVSWDREKRLVYFFSTVEQSSSLKTVYLTYFP
jgi:hypothetical protein